MRRSLAPAALLAILGPAWRASAQEDWPPEGLATLFIGKGLGGWTPVNAEGGVLEFPRIDLEPFAAGTSRCRPGARAVDELR